MHSSKGCISTLLRRWGVYNGWGTELDQTSSSLGFFQCTHIFSGCCVSWRVPEGWGEGKAAARAAGSGFSSSIAAQWESRVSCPKLTSAPKCNALTCSLEYFHNSSLSWKGNSNYFPPTHPLASVNLNVLMVVKCFDLLSWRVLQEYTILLLSFHGHFAVPSGWFPFSL